MKLKTYSLLIASILLIAVTLGYNNKAQKSNSEDNTNQLNLIYLNQERLEKVKD